MVDKQAEIQVEFDLIIGELQTLINEIPAVRRDRNSRGSVGGQISSEHRDMFLGIRTRALKLLSSIDSQDIRLQNSINNIRKFEINRFNMENILSQLQRLRSDYAAEILTLYPRLPEYPVMKTGEKHRWLDEPKAIIIAAIISLLGSVAVAIIVFVMGQLSGANSVTNNAIILTYTPSARQSSTFEPSLVATLDATSNP